MTSAEFQEKNRDYAHTNDRTVVIKGARQRRAIVRRPLRPRHRPRHRSRPLRDGRSATGAWHPEEPAIPAIDVGAHIGFFTMQMAAAVGAAGRVYAFEPFDANADLLEKSLHENRFDDRVVFRRAAVSAAARNRRH